MTTVDGVACRYVSGEHRFRHGYCKSNPRKMVRTWAEKEMRNLKRLTVAGIPCPEPHLLKQHVLIMDFLGEDGWCAPRLREVTLTFEELSEAYASIVKDMRRMYHDCNLVHGDLSEYNLLWHKGRAVIIDVSQSVEKSHPMATDFLRMDINNVNEFFKKKCVHTLSNFRLFQFITSTSPLPSSSLEHGELMEMLSSKLAEMLTSQELDDERNLDDEEENEEIVANAVFLQSYIPSSLTEISNPQAESEKLKKGGQREKIFEMAVQRMLGSDNDTTDNCTESIFRTAPAVDQNHVHTLPETEETSGDDNESLGDHSDDSESEESIENDEDEKDEDGNYINKKKKSDKYRRRLADKSNEEERRKQKEAKREAKKLAKEQAAEKRTKKIPKHVKKRATKKEKK